MISWIFKHRIRHGCNRVTRKLLKMADIGLYIFYRIVMLNLIYAKLTTNMERRMICTYNKKIIRHYTDSEKNYMCKRRCVSNSQFCEYHDEKYFLNNKEELSKKFLDNMIKQDQTNWIGCNIPGFSLQDKKNKNKILLMDAKIHGEINIQRCQFNILDLTGAKFYGGIKMKNVEIDDAFNLENAMFNKNTNVSAEFRFCKFNFARFSNTGFNSCLFEECTLNYSEFYSTIFHKPVKINLCKFINQVVFYKTQYNDEVIFKQAIFQNQTTFQEVDFKKPSKFHYVTFKEQQQVIFDTDLSNVSFPYTDMSRIIFTGKTKWEKDGKFDIFDARKLSNNPQDSDLSIVLSTYRNLRENYEFRLMYEEAGNFFVKEMELKRNYSYDLNNRTTKKKHWIKRNISMANCYNILSKYGEDFGRISFWLIVAFGISLAIFFFCPDIGTLDIDKTPEDIEYATKVSENLEYRATLALERVLKAFFQIEQNGWPGYMVRIASIPLLGMMFVVLRRRFERRFRH